MSQARTSNYLNDDCVSISHFMCTYSLKKVSREMLFNMRREFKPCQKYTKHKRNTVVVAYT